MKKYLFLFLLVVSSLYSIPSMAENICYLPESPGNAYRGTIEKTESETLLVNNYLVIFFCYDVINLKLKDTYAKFNFKNTIRLAKLKWGDSEINSDDYFTKNGETKPYIFVEIGGTIRNAWFNSRKGFTRVSTCLDYQIKNEDDQTSYYFIADYYDDIIDSIDSLFTPLLTYQIEEERKK